MDEQIDLKKVVAENANKAKPEKKNDDHWTQDFETTGNGKVVIPPPPVT